MNNQHSEIKKELINRCAPKHLVEVFLFNLQNIAPSIDKNAYAKGFFADKDLVKGIDFSRAQ